MSGVWSELTAHPWIVAGVVLLLLLLLLAVVGVVWLRRKRSAAEASPSPPPPPPLTRVWSTFVAGLPRSVRGAPVTLLLGPRLSGKTSLLLAAREGRLAATTSTDDARLALYFGENQITAELSSEVWEDAREATVRARRAFLSAVAWQTPTVLVVVDPTSPVSTPEGLTELGRKLRKVVDELDAARRGPVELRVALTHLDLCAPGFAPLMSLLVQANAEAAQKSTGVSTGVELPLRPTGLTSTELAASLNTFHPYLVHGLRAPGLSGVVTFAAQAGPQVLERLSPLFSQLVSASSGVEQPHFDAIYLAAVPPAGLPGSGELSADPFVTSADALDSTATERRAVVRRRWLRTGLVTALLALLLWTPYLLHGSAISRAEESARTFISTAAARTSSTSPATDAAEAQAGEQLRDLLSPRWPPLTAAYPNRKAALRASVLGAIRDTYLLPIARSDDAEARTLALGVLYATGSDALGEAVGALPSETLARIGLPEQVLRDYLTLTESAWTGLPNLPQLTGVSDTSLEGWSAFLQRLDATFRADALTDELLGAIAASARQRHALVDDAAANLIAARVTDQLRARALPVDTWLGRSTVSSQGAQWVSDHRGQLAPLLSLVQNSALAITPPSGGSLIDVLQALGGMVPTSSTSTTTSARMPLYTLDLLGRRYTFDSGRWNTLLESSRATLYLDEYLAQQPETPVLFPASACTGSSGRAAVRGRGAALAIPCQYTREVFAAQIAPPLGSAESSLDKLGLAEAQLAQLTAGVDGAARDYAAQYRASLLDYYSSYQLSCTSAESLGAAVTDMLAPTSFFTQFLITVATNADLGPQDGVFVAPIGESTADLAPIVSIMVEDKGKYPVLAAYYAILTPLTPSLTSSPPGSRTAGTPLAARVSPLGRLALEFLGGGEASAYAQVQRWLDAEGVPQSLRAPFMAPVDCAYQLGLVEVEAAIRRAYTSEILLATDPLFWKFPFDRSSPVDASGVDVQNVLGPKGALAETFELVVLPVVDDLGQGRYLPKTAYPGRQVKLPSGLLELAVYASRLRAWLWTADGRPQPIDMSVQPLPLRGAQGSRTTTLASLRSGKSTVFGFNQTPAWRAVPVSWGLGDSASVALRSTAPSDGNGAYHSIDAEPSDWAFFRLLTKASTVASVLGTVTASWTLPTGASSDESQTISFVFQSDPWRAFAGAPSAR